MRILPLVFATEHPPSFSRKFDLVLNNKNARIHIHLRLRFARALPGALRNATIPSSASSLDSVQGQLPANQPIASQAIRFAGRQPALLDRIKKQFAGPAIRTHAGNFSAGTMPVAAAVSEPA
jgi:hypothetical protein